MQLSNFSLAGWQGFRSALSQFASALNTVNLNNTRFPFTVGPPPSGLVNGRPRMEQMSDGRITIYSPTSHSAQLVPAGTVLVSALGGGATGSYINGVYTTTTGSTTFYYRTPAGDTVVVR